MLGISAEHILEEGHRADSQPAYDPDDAVRISYNRTDPTTLVDGVDHVLVTAENRDTHLIAYSGYAEGFVKVTLEGLIELGEELLGDHEGVPSWLIRSPTDEDSYPWWVPEAYSGDSRFVCQHCGSDTAAGEILIPGGYNTRNDDRICRDCWPDVRENWVPEDDLH